MATPAEWIAGARPRTLPAAVAPVLAGTGVAAWFFEPVWWKAALALVVSLALQVAVNYANDYSDGIRGTDDVRVGPMRLVGSRAATPAAVKRAMLIAFGVAGIAGVVLAVTTAWWLVLVGLVCVVAAWFYTGGSKPYGYLGLGEVMVFVFFGLVATVGTAYVQVFHAWGHMRRGHGDADFGWFAYEPIHSARTIDCLRGVDQMSAYACLPTGNAWLLPALLAGTAIGALACAILVANNLRDIPTDTVAGKMTLAVRLGDHRTRGFYAALVALALATLIGLAAITSWWALLGLVFLLPAAKGVKVVTSGATGPGLIPVLQSTGVAELLLGVGVFVGLLLA
ncbi:1,4-dihydroxy-2-naphthoate octaprenyltransferase [Nocardioides phosphati]|uniref:1,4-dihydroxy-2-naphthoate octaprenyltransferase n=1 Tax=Nocardioides phosphati TaxID=1867775 RepID=A0ABQ2NGT8_9ACTN|nr:1,4-dihydroxy-2-naphthoate polyprenyltransferase [Nocardioides phosphati]GGO94187.1 1,4-dihydroxy-2-naphthoate octaprenyltransferase [Nocardioides phosphati]